MVGTTVSHYKILGKLGEGGMGIVYKAHDLKLDRPVALKFLPAGLTRDAEAMERFVLEARTASTLQHNNICTIHEIDQATDDSLFIAMDFYEGETLTRKISRGMVEAREIIDIGVQVAQGLARAHGRGIVHRDLKPANILVTADGVVKILDFGVAKLGGRASLTHPGLTPGTVAYMSPEQIQGAEATALSDLWSLGVVLYEMAAGKRPFRGDHEAAIMYEVLNVDPPPLRTIRNDLPETLEDAVSRLLQKDPSRRIPSATALAAGLHAAPAHSRYADSPRSIAVLYFENMSIEKENEYFCAGITDDIITDLSKIKGLNVVSRTDVLPFRNKPVNTREVGAALGVGYILEGSVRKAGNRIRITAQLIEVQTGFHVWADRFDRLMEDIFDLQYEVSESIVKALKISLSASEKESLAKKPTGDLRAHDFYMRGREFLHLRGKRNALTAIQMFENALTLDPNYVSAYSALAEAYSNLYTFYDGQAKWLAKIIEVNEKVLSLDPNAVDAQFGMGVVLYHQKRWTEARAIMEKVVARQPDHYDAHRWLGIIADVIGDNDAALAAYSRCAELKPFSEEPWMHLDMAYRRKGDTEASLEAQRNMLERGEAKLAVNPDDAIVLSRLVTRYQQVGDFEKARAAMRRVMEIDPTDGLALYNCACAYALMGDTDHAIEYLRRAIASGYANIKEWIKSDPDFASIQDDPRFQKVLEERG